MEEEENEALDPRVKEELEVLNHASIEINHLELELDEARSGFRQVLSEATQKLNNLAGKLGSCIDKARPYYEARIEAKEAQSETQKAALRFERSCSMQTAAKEMVNLAEQGFLRKGQPFDPAWQEMLNHATLKVNEAEIERIDSELEHQRTATLFNYAEQNVKRLHKELKRSIQKSRPYFEAKSNFNQIMGEQKHNVERLEIQVSKAKKSYASALQNLESISDEIHRQRSESKTRRELGQRSSGVGSDAPAPPPAETSSRSPSFTKQHRRGISSSKNSGMHSESTQTESSDDEVITARVKRLSLNSNTTAVRSEPTGEPDIRTSKPGIHTGELGSQTGEPGIRTDEPGVRTSKPGIRTSELRIRTIEPGIRTDEPGIRVKRRDIELENEEYHFLPKSNKQQASSMKSSKSDGHLESGVSYISHYDDEKWKTVLKDYKTLPNTYIPAASGREGAVRLISHGGDGCPSEPTLSDSQHLSRQISEKLEDRIISPSESMTSSMTQRDSVVDESEFSDTESVCSSQAVLDDEQLNNLMFEPRISSPHDDEDVIAGAGGGERWQKGMTLPAKIRHLETYLEKYQTEWAVDKIDDFKTTTEQRPKSQTETNSDSEL